MTGTERHDEGLKAPPHHHASFRLTFRLERPVVVDVVAFRVPPTVPVLERCFSSEIASVFSPLTKSFAAHDRIFWATHGACRIGSNDLTGQQPVKQDADRCQMLLDGRFFEVATKKLDICCDVDWLN